MHEGNPSEELRDLLEELDWLCAEARSSDGAQANGPARIDEIQQRIRHALIAQEDT